MCRVTPAERAFRMGATDALTFLNEGGADGGSEKPDEGLINALGRDEIMRQLGAASWDEAKAALVEYNRGWRTISCGEPKGAHPITRTEQKEG